MEDCGGALEVSSTEPAQPYLAGYSPSLGQCGEVEQNALGCAGEPGTPCVGLVPCTPAQGDALETRCAEPASWHLARCPI